MSQKKLEDVLKHGIYGTPDTLPEERKLFLGTISERVYLGLTNTQVRQRGIYQEAEALMKEKQDIHLHINGFLSYPSYANYIQTANKYSVPFTIVNDGYDTPLGIVLAAAQALPQQDNIFIKDEDFYNDLPDNERES
ncbi:Uncharacterized protein YueI [Evansella caseinilytica]|uniref:Uncharacterized protein YueI n=1 Tax=Evansella caseinilytica TaxID=1503961 RepID=A0A1H3KQK2_9BACI|nr:YueI family protein [Evansella caseinilytica]SDY54411.1 Uncharacterized protein YueI [Evansella caseinilytica]